MDYTGMAEQIQKQNLVNEIVQWDAFTEQTQEEIKDINEQIKDITADLREELKELRKNLKVAAWKKSQLYSDLRSKAREGYQTTITLDDFATKEIDIALASAEYKKSMKGAADEAEQV